MKPPKDIQLEPWEQEILDAVENGEFVSIPNFEKEKSEYEKIAEYTLKNMITLQPATKEDADFARETHHQAYRDVVEKQFKEWNNVKQDQFFDESWDEKTHEVILFKGEPCGYIHQEVRPDSVYVHELVIHPKFQNRGIGSRILRNIIKLAESKNLSVLLQTFHANRAIGLYKKFGFKEYKRTQTHILLRRNPKEKMSESSL